MLRVVVQKSGRLCAKSLDILRGAGFDVEAHRGRERYVFEDFPLEVLLIRDDDIPSFVHQGACDLGIVGLNVLREYLAAQRKTSGSFQQDISPPLVIEERLGFGTCRLAIAVPDDQSGFQLSWLNGKTIATSYSHVLSEFLASKGISAEICKISGSVESAPGIGLADAVCDLVATGTALRRNHLREVHTLFDSEAVLIGASGQPGCHKKQNEKLKKLFSQRVAGQIKAQKSRYITMNAPLSVVDTLLELIPGLELPSIVPLYSGKRSAESAKQSLALNMDDKNSLVAIHVVAQEPVFWSTIEALKEGGASSILVLPIEKMVD